MEKKLLILLLSLFIFSACGDDVREDEIDEVIPAVAKDSLSIIEAEFIHLADAAVLKGRSFIYGVELDSVGKELVKKTEPLKRDEFDMVPVKVRGKIIKNPERNGWEEIIQIREILEIPEEQSDSVTPPAVNNN